MKIERNRARKGAVSARQFSVSPVTRAVRSVLTISAAALAFSGTGLALASVPAQTQRAPVFASQHADLSQHAAFAPTVPVVDLTLVGGVQHPASVVAGDLGLQAMLTDGNAQYAGPVGPASGAHIDRVLDLTTVQSLVPGPGNGNGSGIDDVIGRQDDRRGTPYTAAVFVNYGETIPVTSPTGYADGVFAATDGNFAISVNRGTINATGYSWAAGVEIESNYQAWSDNYGAINATATGMDGQAIGMYAASTRYASGDNLTGASIHATATGTYGVAIGMFSYADSSASGWNDGSIYASATANGKAVGILSAGNGYSSTSNNGYVLATGSDATGLDSESFGYSSANTQNTGRLLAYGNASAIGETATSAYGSAGAFNNNHIVAEAGGYAVGMQANAGTNATVNNFGDVGVMAYAGVAKGISATGGGTANVYNNNYVGAVGYSATAIEASGVNGARVRNYGTVYAYGVLDATGMRATSKNGGAYAGNRGNIAVNSGYDVGMGIEASGATYAQARNAGGSITVYSYASTAIGALASTADGSATAYNGGTLKIDGIDAIGLQAQASGTGSATANNYGSLNATGISSANGVVALSAYGTATARNSNNLNAIASGAAQGIVAQGDTARVQNFGSVTATSTANVALGMFALGNGVDAYNRGYISATGVVAAGIDAEGALSTNVRNYGGGIVATGDAAAFGIFASSSYGNVGINNWGGITATSANGAAYGIYAYAAGNVDVRNVSSITANGAGTAAGVFAAGSSSNIRNYSLIQANASAGDGFAVGVLAVQGDVSVDNRSFIDARGTYATGVDIRADGSAYGVNRSSIQAYGALATGLSVHTDGETQVANALNYGNVRINATASAVGVEAVSRAYQGTAHATNFGSINLQATNASSAQGLVAAADKAANATNNGNIQVFGGSNSYGELVLSADGASTATNNGYMGVFSSARGGTAFGAIAQSNTGVATVDNNNFIRATGDNAQGMYASAKWNDAHLDNSGTVLATANAGNAFGGLAYSYLNNAFITNSGDVHGSASAAAVGLESLSVGGNASIDNSGRVFSDGTTRSRGLISRSLYGNASVTNSNYVEAHATGNAYGAWARADYAGTSDVTNTSYVRATSDTGSATALRSGGYAGATITNAQYANAVANGNTIARGALAYSVYGDAGVTNNGNLRATANIAAYGVFAQAYDTASVANTGYISARAAYADGIYAGGPSINVTQSGTIRADGDAWSAGIEARGTDITVLATAGDIHSYAIGGKAFGMFALAGGDATLRNNGDMDVTSRYGNAYGEFANAIGHAITTNGGDVVVRAFDGVAYGVLAKGADVDSTNSGTFDVQGYVAAVGMGGLGGTHSILINHGTIDAQVNGNSGTAVGLYSYAVGFARGVNDGAINARANNGTAVGMSVYGDTAVVQNAATGTVDANSYNGTAIGSYSYGTIANTVTNDGTIHAGANYGNATGIVALGGGVVQVNASSTSQVNVNGNGSGFFATGIDARGDIAGVDNAGLVNVNGNGPRVVGVQAFGDTSATIDNTGRVYGHANKYGSTSVIGLLGDATGDVLITNGGNVGATGGHDITGIVGTSAANVTVNNLGTINVTDGFTAYATGIDASTTYGDVAIDNTGTINAGGQSVLKYGFTQTTNNAVGAHAYSEYGIAGITNGGTVNVRADVYGAGLVSASIDGNANVTNTGDVNVSVNGDFALGLGAQSRNGTASVGNDLNVTVTNTNGTAAGGIAMGDTASANNAATGTITVNGIDATGLGLYGNALADGVNDGAIAVNASGTGTGIYAYAYTGTAHVANNGTISVNANGRGLGIQAQSYGNVAVENNNVLDVTATYGSATGIAARDLDYTGGNTTTVSNSGALTVGSQFDAAEGVFAQGEQLAITNTAAGTIAAQGQPWAIGVQGDGTSVSINNLGSIAATSLANNSYAAGIEGAGYVDLTIANGGDVQALSNYGVAKGVGAYGYGTINVANTGTIGATAYNYAIGIDAEASGSGSVTIRNGNAITATSSNDFADGLFASGATIDVGNTGTIDATAPNWAAGMEIDGGTVGITNGGTINATSTNGGQASGIFAYANGALTVGNTGHVNASAYDGTAFGIAAHSNNITTSVTNGGAVLAQSQYGSAYGVQAYGDATTVNNTGTIVAGAYGSAFGIDAESAGTGSVTIHNNHAITATSSNRFADGLFASGATINVNNTATIDATAPTWAAGMEINGDTVGLVNSGTINATSNSGGQASGIYAYADTALTIGNTGHLNASAYDGMAFGIAAYGDYATTSITNGGALHAQSHNGNAMGVLAYGDATTVSNTGTVDAIGFGGATGIQAYANGTAAVTGNGTIHATAGQYALSIGANGDVANVTGGGNLFANASQAFGIHASGNTSAAVDFSGHVTATGIDTAVGVQASADLSSFHNTGVVSATTTADNALSAGALVTGTTASITNAGSLGASASGSNVQAFGAMVLGGDVSLSNTASITASSASSDGSAIGALVGAKYGNGTVTNSGTITATGHAGGTIGLVGTSNGNLAITNSGTVSATDAMYAIALGSYANGTAVITNTGTIIANSGLENSVAIAGGDGIEDIRNAGNISGSMLLGDGNDLLANQNHGTWIVRGHGTDFGGGDDRITNALGGTIVMNNAAIALGAHASAGNAFTNNGMIAINGDSSIDMGTGLDLGSPMPMLPNGIAAAPVTVLNPIAFTNNGTISFLDGAPDDTLTIFGDFAGQGALNVDVSLLNRKSDMLYIDGNVVDGTKQALNVRILDLPKSVTGLSIPVVSITGDSKSGEFVAGTFSIDRVLINANNFVNVKVGVTENLNTANVTADLFNLSVQMDGVNDTGSLAGDIATGAQSLMTTQVGTFRQRMGVFSRMGDSDTGAWVRVFHDKGSISPQFKMDNMPQNGQFGFDQNNSGVEAGFNALVTDGVYLGATLAKADGKQTLDNGAGSDKLKGDTAGLYVTYLSPTGFYADVSYRWMHFDADLTSAGGKQKSGGDVGAFNVEAGWNVWTSAGGLKLVPQAQYTRSEVSNVDVLNGDLASFRIDGGHSSRARAGLELEQVIKSSSGATWTPYGTLSVVREFDGENKFSIADTFTGSTSTKGTSGMLEVGANVKMGNVDIYGGLNWTDGGAFNNVFGGQVGLRYTW